MSLHPILLNGSWRRARSTGSFHAHNPATGTPLPGEYPTSSWGDCDEALTAATSAAETLRNTSPEKLAGFLSRYAERIDARKTELVDIAHAETGLPKSPRLSDVELARTTNQLRQAAAAVLEGSWALPTIDTKANLRSTLAPLGPVLVFGPNNFPYAYNGVAGGDFAAAIAAGNPVIAKAHPSHPGTSRILAEEAFAAVHDSGLPAATVQMIYNIAPEDGLRLAADPRLGAIGFTGSRHAGLRLKAAADAVGKPIYAELSSLNPVVILPGALAERGPKIAEEFTASMLMASGQFCTSPGLIVLIAGPAAEDFIATAKARLEAAPVATLLSSGVARSLGSSVETLRSGGAQLVTGGKAVAGEGVKFENTLLRASGDEFLGNAAKLQTEAFGNAALVITVRDVEQAAAVLTHLEGNLTGAFYTDTRGSDDQAYAPLEPILRPRVGRLLNDKMPTGVAFSSAMNHGGPFPATGHPGFTAVGIPGALRRFAALYCYDNVRASRLPPALRDENPNGKMWRLIDGTWTQRAVGP